MDYNDWPEWKRAAWGFPAKQPKQLKWEDFADESEEVTQSTTTEIPIQYVPVDTLLDWAMEADKVHWDPQPTHIDHKCEELWDPHAQPTKYVRTHTQRVRYETRDVKPIIDGRNVSNIDILGDTGKP